VAPNEGVEKLKIISHTTFWLLFRLEIASFFEYKVIIVRRNYSRPLSTHSFFKHSIFLQPERLAKRKITVGYNREAMANYYFSV